MLASRWWVLLGALMLMWLGIAAGARGEPRILEIRYDEHHKPVAVERNANGSAQVHPPSGQIRVVSIDEISRAVLRSNSKATLLALYAAWCGACRHQMPLVAKLAQSQREAGLQMLAFSLDRNPSRFEQYTRQFRGAFALTRLRPYRRGELGAQLRKLGMRAGNTVSIPRFGVFDRDHRLVAQSNRIARLGDALTELLPER